MDKRSIMVKELIIKSSEISQIDGNICARIKLKEIIDTRYEILPLRTVIGDNVIAYFGDLKVKIICVDEESQGLFLVEEVFHYKGFFLRDIKRYSRNRTIAINSTVMDIFTEITDHHHIRVTGVISTEIEVFLEKEQRLDEFRQKEGKTGQGQLKVKEPESELDSEADLEPDRGQEKGERLEIAKRSVQTHRKDVDLIDLINRAEKDGFSEIQVEMGNGKHTDGEIFTGVESGQIQDLTITLE